MWLAGLAILAVAVAAMLMARRAHSSGVAEGAPAAASVTRTGVGGPLGKVSRTPAAGERPTTRFPLAHFARALDAIDGEADGMAREGRIEELVEAIKTADIPEALSRLRDRERGRVDEELNLRFVRRWAESDPGVAARWVAGLPQDAAREALAEGVAILWANRSVDSAVDWALGLGGAEGVRALTAIAYEAVRENPLASIEIAATLPESSARDDLVRHAASEWASTAPEAALDWVLQFEDPAMRNTVLSEIARTWGGADAVAAATLAVTAIEPGRAQDDAIMGIVQRWVQGDAEKAAGWVGGFPPGPLRRAAIETTVNLWAECAPDQAASWLLDMPQDADRDAALAVFSNRVALRAPADAMAFAEAVTDGPTRIQAVEAVAGHWLLRDSATARVWIQRSELSDDVKDRLLAEP
jgi:hypothetical protein